MEAEDLHLGVQARAPAREVERGDDVHLRQDGSAVVPTFDMPARAEATWVSDTVRNGSAMRDRCRAK